MIKYFTIPVPPGMTGFINHIWAVEGDGAEAYIHRSVALELPYLVFHYHGSFDQVIGNERIQYPITHFQGQTKKYRLFNTTKSFGIFGVNLYPFVTPLLTGMPSYEISDQVHDLTTLLGPGARELEEKIMLAYDNLDRARLVVSFLEAKLRSCKIKDHTIIESIRHVVRSGKFQTVSQLAEQYNLSVRQFERKFKEYAGFSPKLFSRIARFQEAFMRCEENKRSLLDIAHSCGYYDQAHFNHDFKQFSGFHPTDILGQRDHEFEISYRAS